MCLNYFYLCIYLNTQYTHAWTHIFIFKQKLRMSYERKHAIFLSVFMPFS